MDEDVFLRLFSFTAAESELWLKGNYFSHVLHVMLHIQTS